MGRSCVKRIVLVLLSFVALCASAPVAFEAFTIPGCGHCTALKPAWAALQARVAADPELAAAVSVQLVDCAEEKPRCGGIHAFPTLRFGGAPYTGAKDESALLLFVRKNAGPAVREAPWAVWRDADPKGAVIMGGGSCAAQVRGDFDAAAERLRGRMFFVWDASAGLECSVRAWRASVNETEQWMPSRGPLGAWAAQQVYPILAPFDRWIHAASQQLVAYLFFEGELAANAGAVEAVRNASLALRYAPLARPLLFAHVERSVWDGVRTGIALPYPRVAVVDHAKLNHHYRYPGGGDVHPSAWLSLDAWLQDVASGRVERTIVSEPDTGDDKVVATSLERLVTKRPDDRDVLVLFSSPHCGSSQSFQPTWKALLRELQRNWDASRLVA